ncbi:hypothetical protein CDAR_55291 [Caerostris darwini]|uniref:Uncharacterized protein n=1 Tax=Caerostris darwini TaxID=1538125 RepID=A0AAV4R8U6_9ARAC|nr:hypothetical protein CDAR_55291 [Caerostris darwini]
METTTFQYRRLERGRLRRRSVSQSPNRRVANLPGETIFLMAEKHFVAHAVDSTPHNGRECSLYDDDRGHETLECRAIQLQTICGKFKSILHLIRNEDSFCFYLNNIYLIARSLNAQVLNFLLSPN